MQYDKKHDKIFKTFGYGNYFGLHHLADYGRLPTT